MKHMQYQIKGHFFAWLQVVLLLLATLTPLLLVSQNANAAILTSRYVELFDSDGGQDDVIYQVGFTTVGATDLEWIVIEFCSDSPIVGEACAAPAGLDTNEATLTIENETGIGTDFTVHQASTDANTLILTDATPTAVAGSVAVTFRLGTGAANNGIDNPNADNTSFYARILTYDDNADAEGSAYTSTVPGTHTDDGGVAMSTAEQITVTAKVQEKLTFCVGTIVTTTGDCSTFSGNTINLGTLDTVSVTRSSAINGTSGTCDATGLECAFMATTTNATTGGVVIDYVAEAFDVGATCPSGTTASGSETDQCLNPIDEAAETTITAASEAWGIAVINHQPHASSGTTDNLDDGADDNVGSAAYDFRSSGYAVNDGTTSIRLLGSENGAAAVDKVVDREQVELEVAASPTYTTPSGSYQTTLTFIATGTF